MWVLMSESTAGGQIPVTQVTVTAAPVIALKPAVPPPGAIFEIGWLTAALFDPRRRASVAERQPPFDPSVQLPQVGDLGADAKLVFYAAALTELTGWYPHLVTATAKVTAETDKKKPADPPDSSNTVSSDTVSSDTGPAAAPFDEAAFSTALSELNEAVLDEFADDPERLSAYQLGLALSDLCWLPSLGSPATNAGAGAASASVLSMFSRSQVATIKMLLNGAGEQIPTSSAAMVSKSLDNWAEWLDVNAAKINGQGSAASTAANTVADALRLQGAVWHSVLIADPEVSVAPVMGAWVQAGSAIVRNAQLLTVTILRQFWPLVILTLAVLGAVLYLIISNLAGLGQVWASLAAVAAILGSASYGVSSGVSSAYDGVGYEIWSAAKLEAGAWNVTWLPALVQTVADRRKLSGRGVAAPQLRKRLDVH
jgi:hypothetical protein